MFMINRNLFGMKRKMKDQPQSNASTIGIKVEEKPEFHQGLEFDTELETTYDNLLLAGCFPN